MNCEQARQHWELYYDSEGDAEVHLRLNAHLENCPRCAEYFAQQGRLESLIESDMRTVPEGAALSEGDWSRILERAGVVDTTRPPTWRVIAPPLLAVIAASLLVWIGFVATRSTDSPLDKLANLSLDVHRHVSNGSLRPEFESRSDIAVDRYLVDRVSFPVRCPPRKDSGFHVSGAGMCKLGQEQAAYVVGTVDQRPVSIFVLPRDSLAAFPGKQTELQRQVMHARRRGESELVSSVIDKNLVLVIGETERAKLSRVLTSYGTYPHSS